MRVYNHALTPSEITASRTAGPDVVSSPPTAQPDAVTIHPGQKTRIAVLANDTGPLTASTVVIAQAPVLGTATPDAEGRILYNHSGTDLGPVNFTYTVAGPRYSSLVTLVN